MLPHAGGLTYEFSNSTEGPGVAGRVGVEKLCAKLKWERPLLITQHCGDSHKNDFKGMEHLSESNILPQYSWLTPTRYNTVCI